MRWSDIMNFNNDRSPRVGKLSQKFGGGDRQLICVGYTEERPTSLLIMLIIETPNALSCEVVVYIILGKEPPKYFSEI